jgi:hypothetical protein
MHFVGIESESCVPSRTTRQPGATGATTASDYRAFHVRIVATPLVDTTHDTVYPAQESRGGGGGTPANFQPTPRRPSATRRRPSDRAANPTGQTRARHALRRVIPGCTRFLASVFGNLCNRTRISRRVALLILGCTFPTVVDVPRRRSEGAPDGRWAQARDGHSRRFRPGLRLFLPVSRPT